MLGHADDPAADAGRISGPLAGGDTLDLDGDAGLEEEIEKMKLGIVIICLISCMSV